MEKIKRNKVKMLFVYIEFSRLDFNILGKKTIVKNARAKQVIFFFTTTPPIPHLAERWIILNI